MGSANSFLSGIGISPGCRLMMQWGRPKYRLTANTSGPTLNDRMHAK